MRRALTIHLSATYPCHWLYNETAMIHVCSCSLIMHPTIHINIIHVYLTAILHVHRELITVFSDLQFVTFPTSKVSCPWNMLTGTHSSWGWLSYSENNFSPTHFTVPPAPLECKPTAGKGHALVHRQCYNWTLQRIHMNKIIAISLTRFWWPSKMNRCQMEQIRIVTIKLTTRLKCESTLAIVYQARPFVMNY